MKTLVLFATAICIIGTSHAQEKLPKVLSWDSISGSPEANLEAVEWIQGHWRAEAFNGTVEEIWSPPLGGSMMGSFKLVVDDTVVFYEIETITEENNTLMLRLKHFNADLTGWEDKDETVGFPLVKVTENKVFFDGFTFEKGSKDKMNIYIITGNKDKKEISEFHYSRYP